MRAARAAAVCALLASLLASACYKPSLKSGGFQCAANGACPDGFKCNMQVSPPLCVSSLPDAGVSTGGSSTGGVVGTGGKGGSGAGGHVDGGGGMGGKGGAGAGGAAGAAGAPCLPQIANCAPTDAGLCDPVCNTRCGACSAKCSVNTAGTLTCNAPSGARAGFNQPCLITETGGDVSTQTDNCTAGQVCMSPSACGQLCYQFCRSNSDCASQNCGRDIGNGLKVCDVPSTACDPTLLTQCGGPLTACYISSDSGRTVCDCPNNASLGTLGKSCLRSRDCYAGLVCYSPTGKVGSSTCQRVCRLPTDGGAPDAGGSTCNGGPANCAPMRLSGSGALTTVWGYCNEPT